MASKKRKRAGTLLERHGFKDPDAGTPVHDGICAWLDKNMAKVCGELFPQRRGTITVEEKIWEKPIHRTSGGYDGRQSSAVVGFADMAAKVKWTHTDDTRWREVDAGVLAWVEDPATFEKKPQILRKFEKLDWKHVYFCDHRDHSDDDAGFAALAAAGVHARVSKNFEETDHVEGCHRYRLVDSKVLRWADGSCIGSDGGQTYENGVAGWHRRPTLEFRGLRKYYMKKTEETVTCPKGVGDLLAGLGTVHATAFARVRDGIPPDDTDDVRRKVTSNDETIVFEAKSAIPSLGDILRELQFYKEHTTYNTKLVVVCHDDTHAPTIREQGFLFYKCPDLSPLANIPRDRGIGRFFSAPASNKMPDMGWTLEVVRFNRPEDKNGPVAKYTHVGYMDAHFRTKKDACSYYARHNPHMRALDAHGGCYSDWDPCTELAYIIREEQSVHATVPPFDPDDASVAKGNEETSEWLK